MIISLVKKILLNYFYYFKIAFWLASLPIFSQLSYIPQDLLRPTKNGTSHSKLDLPELVNNEKSLHWTFPRQL